jgi:GGDEF domain-containing protein
MEALSNEFSGGKRIGIKEFLLLFNQFSKEEQIQIAEKISLQTFADRWVLLDEELPDTDELSEEEIMAEVKAVRYGEKEKV